MTVDYSKKFARLAHNIILSPERFFLVATLVIGISFLLLIPPFQTPDENVHLYRAYEVADLKIPKSHAEGIGSYLPSSIRKTEVVTKGQYDLSPKSSQLAFHYETKYDIAWTSWAIREVPLDQSDKIFYTTTGNPLYNPLGYIYQAIVVKILNIFNTPVVISLYAVRVTSLLIWTAVGYYSIKIVNHRKWGFVGVMLLPSVVSQMISPGQDPQIFSGLAIVSAYVVRSFSDKNFNLHFKDICILFVCSLIVVVTKPVYLPMLVSILFIKRKQIRLGKIPPLIAKISIVILPLIIMFSWNAMTRTLSQDSLNSYSADQIERFTSNPFIFLVMLFNTIFVTAYPTNFVTSSIIGNFGWLDAPLAGFVIVAGYVYLSALLFLGFENRPKYYGKRYTRLFLNLLLAGAVLLIYFSMFIFATSPVATSVNGVNGRYLLPVLFIAIVTWQTKIKISKRQYKTIAIYGVLGLFLASLITIIARYYTSHQLI